MTPASRGEVDELLEPVRIVAGTHHAAIGQRRNARQPSLPTSDRRTLVRNPTTNITHDASLQRARAQQQPTHDQHEPVDTAPLLQECRSAPDLYAPKGRTERSHMSATYGARSAVMIHRARLSRW
jgi:hypothetical protein